MEVPEMDGVENHIPSASAFVKGGIQDACDDACSICLDDFSDSNPSTMTTCNHEFHLQCILEWCQRSSNCPMCWQPVRLNDPTSQELLMAVEQERSFRSIPSRNVRIYHRPTITDFNLQHFPGGVNDPELEHQFIQHLAAAAAMQSSHHFVRGEGSRGHSSSRSPVMPTTSQEITNNDRSYSSDSSSPNSETAGPSDIWRSRLSSMLKESISRSTRGWREKLFSRSPFMADIGSEVRREINPGIATISRMMERLETRDNIASNSAMGSSVMEHINNDNRGHYYTPPSNGNNTTSAAN